MESFVENLRNKELHVARWLGSAVDESGGLYVFGPGGVGLDMWLRIDERKPFYPTIIELIEKGRLTLSSRHRYSQELGIMTQEYDYSDS